MKIKLNKMWKVKKKICPKNEVSPPIAKLDQFGNLVTNQEQLKSLYVDTYKDRLRHRDMKPSISYLRHLKDFLFNERFELSKLRKSMDWTPDNLLKIQKSLKTRKSADPSGLINELFKPGVAGTDVNESLLLISNKVKYECEIPDFLELTNITSLYKHRGSKSDLNSDRGIFNVSAVRSVIDKLVYEDIYDVVDGNMSDSNVGGRRGRNIRDNLFIINGVINYAIKENIDIDISLYDIAKCFDAMWYQETMNDLWDVGVKDDKFALLAKMNKKCNIAVKTPAGISDRFIATEIEMQGTVVGPLKACVQVDTLGRESYMYGEGLFIYKGGVYLPPLSMCDDVASISLCGVESIKTNAIINAKIESKKLEFGPTKCFNIHVGKKTEDCCSLKVHNLDMIRKDSEVYLGDVICSSGTNHKNISNKTNQGVGAVSQIFSMLHQVSLGHYYFDISLIMRDAILASKLVSSSEVWYNVTQKEYESLEKVDEMFYRRLFDVPISTPKESLYIEGGKVPIRFVIQMRRMMYWWHLVHIDQSEVLRKFYLVQKMNASKGDWVLQLEKDKKDLNLDWIEEKVKSYSKEQFRNLVKTRIEINAGKHLEGIRLSHSKTENIKFVGFKPAAYLLSKNLTIAEVKTLFKLRTRMIDVKVNFGNSHKENMWCRLCQLFCESQQHLLECPVIRANLKGIINFQELDINMIFGKVQNQEKFTKSYHTILQKRKDLLENEK